jgi:hypothetical protein
LLAPFNADVRAHGVDAHGIARPKLVRPGVVSKFEIACFAVSVVIWLIALCVPANLALVPEYVTRANFVLLLSAVLVLLIASRQLWLWWRWWSIPVDIALLGTAIFPLSMVGNDVIEQLQPPPSEGFMYSGGFLCSTHVDRVSQKPDSQERLYVLVEHCIPDGPVSRVTYVRNGTNLFMRRLD